MANPDHIAKLDQDSEAWNQWLTSQSVLPDLSAANLHGKDLNNKNLCDADLKHADLSSATLLNADLEHADLRGADLRGADFTGSSLSGASLREANLQGVDLSVARRGLQTEQLAGADLTSAILPEELKKLYDGLQNVNNISESARKLFLAVLAACLYSWLTIATTTDVNLITNRASSPLPIIQTSIPIVGFYWVAPLLLLCVYFYFHFYLQKLWEELGSLPAILPDGRPLHAKIDPWLLNDLVRAHLPKLNVNRPFLSYFQLWISVLLAWWVVPVTLFLFWARYLPRHELAGTTFHVALLVTSFTAAWRLYRLAVATLRGIERTPFNGKRIPMDRRGYQTVAFAAAFGVLFGIVSLKAIRGDPSDRVPRSMWLVGYSPFANLAGADVSQKKSNWNKGDKDLDSVVGAKLSGADLSHASSSEAFLVGADLSEAYLGNADLSRANLYGANLCAADLESADLTGAKLSKAFLRDAILPDASLLAADLKGADLSYAYLVGADLRGDLRGAQLEGAHLRGADLEMADLRGADLNGADLRGAHLGSAQTEGADLSNAIINGEWTRKDEKVPILTLTCTIAAKVAFLRRRDIESDGTSSDHNDKLAEQQKKEKGLQQKQNARQTAPKAAPSSLP